jgi:hypothetical protein
MIMAAVRGDWAVNGRCSTLKPQPRKPVCRSPGREQGVMKAQADAARLQLDAGHEA